MSETGTKVLRSALSLSALERAEIADELLSSLDRPDDRIDQLWIAEAERRIAKLKAGETETISAEEVFADLETA